MPGPIDRRFPRLYAIDDPRVPGPVADFAREVCVRCQCRVAYDMKLEQFHFYYSDIESGILQLEAIRPDGSLAIWKHNVQDIVEWIQRGKIERFRKDLIEKRNKAAEEAETENAMDKFLDDCRPGVQHYAAFLERSRRGWGQRIFVN